MNILHLANFYHSESGGIKTYLDNKREYFSAANLPFRLVIPDQETSVQYFEDDTIIYRIKASKAPFNPAYRLIWNLGAVHKIVKREKPDLIEVNDKYTLALLSLYYRVFKKFFPLVGFHHERLDTNMILYFKDNKLYRKLAHWGMNLVSKAFDKIICASQYTADEIAGIAPEKIEVINLGTDTGRFSPELADDELRQQYLQGADHLLLYVGRLAREKNLALLTGMMDMLRQQGVNARLLVAGVGPDIEMFNERPDSTVLGYVKDREEIARINASSDALIFPSVREPFGLVPLEALSSGLPVICANTGGVLEYSNCDAVWSVNPTVSSFVNAFQQMSTVAREDLRRIARKHAEKFSWGSTFSRQLEFYQEIVTS